MFKPNPIDEVPQRASFFNAQRIQRHRFIFPARLAAYKAPNDYQYAAASVQQIANLEAEKTNLVNLHQQYVES